VEIMATLWIAAILLATPPGDVTTTPEAASPALSPPAVEAEQPLVPPRSGVELRDAVRDALKRWAQVEDKQAQLAAREFLLLYQELGADDQMARSQREQLRTKVRGRLLTLSVQVKKWAAIQRRLAKKQQPQSVDVATQPNADTLAQFGGFGGQGGMMGGGQGGMMGMGGGGFGGAARDDYGEDLVELIQRTVAPTTWDVNGGPGSIYYWRNQRALIIRQMGEVHDEIGGVLEQLHRAGH
jgi:hypothetical protein